MEYFRGIRFYTHALAAGIKPILGCDLKVRNPKDAKLPFRMGVICMDHEATIRFCVLLTKAYLTDSDPYRGQVDPAWFDEDGAKGLIGLTGGADGEPLRCSSKAARKRRMHSLSV